MTNPTLDIPTRGGKGKAVFLAKSKQGEAMKKAASHGRTSIAVGDVVLVQVAAVDRAKTDPHRIPGAVLKVTDAFFCRIGVIGGVLKDCLSRETLMAVPDQTPATYGLEIITNSWPTAKKI